MRIRILILGAALLAAGVWATAAAVPPTIVQVPPPMLATVDGAELYAAYCTSCHGPSGRGDGAVAPYLAIAAPDLTRIAERNGEFDYWAVHRGVSGVDRALGSVMPIWSSRLATAYANRAREEVILRNLVLHLQSLQEPAMPPIEVAAAHSRLVLKPVPPLGRTDGPTVYAALCADCHGATGRGDGRLSMKLGTPVPDLTRWSERNGGFDQEKVWEAISDRHMVPVADADPWWEVMTDSYGFTRGARMIAGLTHHLEEMQADR